MKLNKYSNKNLIKIFLVICFISITISISNNRLTKKGKTKADPFLMAYEANLMIENTTKNTKEEVAVSIEKKNLENISYGFEVTVKNPSATILSPAFFPTSTKGNFFLSLKNLSNTVDCTNDGLFSKNGMIFIFSIGGDSISVTIKYPNSWAFGEKNDLTWLCLKIAENYRVYSTNISDSKNAVIQAVTSTTDLEKEKAKNIKNKTDLDNYVKEQTNLKEQTITEIKALDLRREALLTELRNIENSKITKQKQNQDNDLDIAVLEEKLRNIEKYISEKSSSAATIKLITDTEVNAKWEDVKSNITKLADAHTSSDPYSKSLRDLLTNIQINKDKIFTTLK